MAVRKTAYFEVLGVYLEIMVLQLNAIIPLILVDSFTASKVSLRIQYKDWMYLGISKKTGAVSATGIEKVAEPKIGLNFFSLLQIKLFWRKEGREEW